jgi:hypothetical protein
MIRRKESERERRVRALAKRRVYQSLVKAKRVLERLNIPWSLSGSAAMNLYGQQYGVRTRVPVDIDIVVNANNMKNVYRSLAPRNARPISGNRNHYQLGVYDILKANSRLAPNLNNYQTIRGIPVVPLNKLVKQKYESYKNNPRLNQVNKIKSNFATLQKLLNASKRRKVNLNTSNLPSRSQYARRYN